MSNTNFYRVVLAGVENVWVDDLHAVLEDVDATIFRLDVHEILEEVEDV